MAALGNWCTRFCIAEPVFAKRNLKRSAWGVGLAVLLMTQAAAQGQAASQAGVAPTPLPPVSAPSPDVASGARGSPATSARPWIAIPRLTGRLTAADVGLVINTADPDSVAVGRHYIAARKLKPAQVLRLQLPIKPTLTPEEFEVLRQAIQRRFGPATQALALAWTVPYAVDCNAITGALALGFDPELCRNGCGASRSSRYFNAATDRPMALLGWRPAMLLAAPSVEAARAMIDRGVASDGQLAQRGRPPVSAMLLQTDDAARSVRRVLYPEPGLRRAVGVDVQVVPAAELANAKRVVMVSTGSVFPTLQPRPDWVPGGLGDHLTSFGGDLLGAHGQGTALDWIASGATASHGSVSEPCNHLQKFPHPQVLLGHYVQGATAIEAYWKSVAWPQQSLFIGEPLAAPFSPRLVATSPVQSPPVQSPPVQPALVQPPPVQPPLEEPPSAPPQSVTP